MNIYQAIATVSAEVGALVADGHNRDQNYRYITADKVLERAGGAMAKAGLVVIPAVKHEATEQITYTSFGKEKTRYDSTVEFDMTIATADGEPVVMHWIGRGSDYAVPDKALYKAITSGHKYFLMKLFNIGVGNEDGEHENPPAEPQNQRQEPRKPRQSTNGRAEQEPPVDGENDAPPTPMKKPTPTQLKAMHAAGSAYYGQEWDIKRHELVSAVTKGRTTSSKHLTADECKTITDGINRKATAASA